MYERIPSQKGEERAYEREGARAVTMLVATNIHAIIFWPRDQRTLVFAGHLGGQKMVLLPAGF